MKLTHNDTCLIQTESHGVLFPTSYMTALVLKSYYFRYLGKKEGEKKC